MSARAVKKPAATPPAVIDAPRAAAVTRPVPAIISEFQPDAVELEERVPPRVARLTLYGVTALILCGIAWASLASIDEIVVAPGKLITTTPTIVVQPLETSIIRTIEVADGDIVHAGQTLVTLDATFTQSDVDQQRSKFAALDAQVKRSEAELAGTDYAATAGSSPDEKLQVQLFGQRRAFYIAQLQNYDQQIAGQQAVMQSSVAQEAVLKNQSDTLAQVEAVRQSLYEHQTGSLLDLLNSRDARLDVDATLAQQHGNGIEAQHAMAKLQADRQAFIEDFRRATMEQLVDFRSNRDAAEDELKKMELRRNMVTLTAPADAVVLDLAQKSIGSVVREAEPIVTLVPLNVPLEAEVSINGGDIGHVLVDEPARIKFDAYPFQKFGTATGSIRTISRDAFPADPNAKATGAAALPFFKARVLLADTDLRQSSETVHLLPGMTVSAEIKVGSRSVISYFLYPLLRGLDDSIKEP
ncbi:MAG TPA: HlyD family type I secretion periplasmic adaptor subunit [Devosiaceae bacterium]|jgi:HlyD family secretion protein